MAETMTKQKAGALAVIGIIKDAIQEAGEEGIPSGHLYAILCGKMSLESYQGVIDILERVGLITVSNYLLKAIVTK